MKRNAPLSNEFTDAEITEIENRFGTVKDINAWARGRFGFERIKGIDFNRYKPQETINNTDIDFDDFI